MRTVGASMDKVKSVDKSAMLACRTTCPTKLLSDFWTHRHPGFTAHADPLRKSTHFLHQCTSPFATLPSVLFYKEGLHTTMQHSS
jgi:hypothetical protein